HIGQWNGTSWQPLGTGMSTGAINPTVSSLTVFGTSLVAGGSFTTASGVPANRIAQWNGTNWQALGSGFADATALSVAVHNGQLFAGGSFTAAGATTVNRVAQWVPGTPGAWQPLGAGTSAPVNALASFKGNLVAGGDFLTAGGGSMNYIAQWSGAAWRG